MARDSRPPDQNRGIVTSLLEFIEARLAEDGQIAHAATEVDGKYWSAGAAFHDDYDRVEGSGDTAVGYDMFESVPPHIARHDPARILREVESKRRIVEWASTFGYTKLMEELALPYRDHPDYDPEWAL
jgi:hypothetical protein